MKQTLVILKVLGGFDIVLTDLCQFSVGFLDSFANQNHEEQLKQLYSHRFVRLVLNEFSTSQ